MSSVDEFLTDIRRRAQRVLTVTGPCDISGSTRVQGSKNAANKLVAVTAAFPGKYRIGNFPLILDPLELLSIIELLGGSVTIEGDTANIDTTNLQSRTIPRSLTKTTSGSFGFAGALLGRFGRVNIGKPGGDDIGPRPVDLHSEGFRALGARVEETSDTLLGTLAIVPKNKIFRLRIPSTGAAVNVILAAAAAGGTAQIENTPVDGDMESMYQLMRVSGIKLAIEGSTIKIDASKQRRQSTIDFTCPPDRNDAFTWLAYGAISQRGLKITDLSVDDIATGLDVLRSLNVEITKEGDGLLVKAPTNHSSVDTMVVAGLAKEFHSDWAPLLEVVLTTVPGRHHVIDTVFSNRVRQAELLQTMGAEIKISGGPPSAGVQLHFSTPPEEARYILDIAGPSKLRPIVTEVGYDLRACAAMIMATSQATGVSRLSNIQALYRGYENILERLRAIGVKINAD